MTKKDCKMFACGYALASGCALGQSKEQCAYHGDGSCKDAVCSSCLRQSNDKNCPKNK